MTLTPLSAYTWFTVRGARLPVAWLFTLGVWLAFLFLRLESPAWQALLAERQRLYPQLAGKRPTLGDPLRLLIQSCGCCCGANRRHVQQGLAAARWARCACTCGRQAGWRATTAAC